MNMRAAAIAALLALPDAPDLLGVWGRRRGYRYTQPRDPKRDADRLKRDLGIAYVERRRHERGKDISAVVSKRTFVRGQVVPFQRGA